MSFLLLAVGCTVPNDQYLGGDGGAIDGEGAGNADAEIERDGGAPDLAFDQPDGGSPEDGAVHDSDGSTPFDLAEHPTDLLNPSCGAGTDDCDHDPSTSCDPLNTSVRCGSCSTACFPAGGTNACVAQGAAHVCKPSCDATHYDCDGLGPNGCEVNLASDPGEPDDGCPGVTLSDVNEGQTLTLGTRRILPAGDTDTYSVKLKEGTHVCTPFDPQPYVAIVSVDSPAGAPLALGIPDDPSSCTNTWAQPSSPTRYCYQIDGTCGLNDVRSIHFQVQGSTPGTASCLPYTLKVRFCAFGSTCNNCL